MNNLVEEIQERTAELKKYCVEYYKFDAPTISDAEYDKKYDELKALEDKANYWLADSPTRKVQGEVLPYLTKVAHSSPMLSADKSTDIEDIKSFIGEREVMASYKLDGATLVCRYDNGELVQAVTRGDGEVGEDVTHTARMITNLPLKIPYDGFLEVRGEVLISWEDYRKMNVNEDMGHPRNVASGALRQLDANIAKARHLQFKAFTLVNWRAFPEIKRKSESMIFVADLGISTVPWVNIECCSLDIGLDMLNREKYELPTDGWCFEYNDLAYGESLGSTGHHDRRLFALKPEPEKIETKFRGVKYNTCRTGVVSLTAEFDPVEIGNTIVSRATLHNVDFFRSMKLGIGDVLVVTKMNEIIPGILENVTKSGTYELTDTCPSCGGKLIVRNTGTANTLYCPNSTCPAKLVSALTHFVSKQCMNIEGMSEATISLLCDKGLISSAYDIYTLSQSYTQLVQLPGLGVGSVNQMLASIEHSRTTTLDRYLCALGIPNVGKSTAKMLAKAFNNSWDDFYTKVLQGVDLTTLPDFGPTSQESLMKWAAMNLLEANRLARCLFFDAPQAQTLSDSALSGKVFVITGTLQKQSRAELVDKLTYLGATVGSAVNKKTHYLVINDKNSTSSKTAKAKELGTKMIDEFELYEMMDNA